MDPKSVCVPAKTIEEAILLIRGQKVMLDADLAILYGVQTKALNQAVKRNARRFPLDFMFRLTRVEKNELVTNCDRLQRLRHSSGLPRAFTEQGVAMLSSVLKSERAIDVNVEIMRAFVRLRQMLAAHKDFAHRIADLEKKYDKQFKVVFDAIRALMTTPTSQSKPIGFQVKEKGAVYKTKKGRIVR
jgi:hypothetical protein